MKKVIAIILVIALVLAAAWFAGEIRTNGWESTKNMVVTTWNTLKVRVSELFGAKNDVPETETAGENNEVPVSETASAAVGATEAETAGAETVTDGTDATTATQETESMDIVIQDQATNTTDVTTQETDEQTATDAEDTGDQPEYATLLPDGTIEMCRFVFLDAAQDNEFGALNTPHRNVKYNRVKFIDCDAIDHAHEHEVVEFMVNGTKVSIFCCTDEEAKLQKGHDNGDWDLDVDERNLFEETRFKTCSKCDGLTNGKLVLGVINEAELTEKEWEALEDCACYWVETDPVTGEDVLTFGVFTCNGHYTPPADDDDDDTTPPGDDDDDDDDDDTTPPGDDDDDDGDDDTTPPGDDDDDDGDDDTTPPGDDDDDDGDDDTTPPGDDDDDDDDTPIDLGKPDVEDDAETDHNEQQVPQEPEHNNQRLPESKPEDGPNMPSTDSDDHVDLGSPSHNAVRVPSDTTEESKVEEQPPVDDDFIDLGSPT